MSPLSKTALVATLVLSASIGITRLTRSEVTVHHFANLFSKKPSQGVDSSLSTKATKPLTTSNLFNLTFEPDPNDPPTTTGGSGTR